MLSKAGGSQKGYNRLTLSEIKFSTIENFLTMSDYNFFLSENTEDWRKNYEVHNPTTLPIETDPEYSERVGV